jgi:hypothetical protein
MFRITQDPSSGSIDSYLIKTTRNGSTVLVVCAVGVWRHIQDLWCVCTSRLIKVTNNNDARWKLEIYLALFSTRFERVWIKVKGTLF